MRDPRKKKRRDLRRALRSAHRPHAWKLFARYHPEWSDRDPDTGQIDWAKWSTPGFHEEAWLQEFLWKHDLCGYEPYWQGSPPAWYRRDANRKLRARQKAAFDRAARDNAWDDFLMPYSYRNIRYDWW